MTTRILWIFMITALIVPERVAATSTAADGDADRGRTIFKTYGCALCHGTVGQGGVGARLAPSPLPTESIAAYIRNPGGEMPPYSSNVVSGADIRDIRAYLATIPQPPSVSDIPELR